MNHLFSPLTLRGLTLRNRVVVSPMCEYSSDDGFANDWHLVHLGSRAVGGAGLVLTEAAAVEARGRISPQDLGLWKDEHIPMLRHINRFLHAQGSATGVQLAHAGRKGSTRRPWERGAAATVPPSEGGWQTVAPTAVPFAEGYPMPMALTVAEIGDVTRAFVDAARRAHEAEFDVVELHGAHGYLMHQFISPIANQRTDDYGGSFANRTRFLCETTAAVRAAWPEDKPLFVRLSVTDWAEGGESWDEDQSVEVSRLLKESGVDLIDCSSGGTLPHAKIPVGPGYQTRFAARIRREADIPTGAVGMITAPEQADQIVRTEQSDLVFLARELLRDPYWPTRAAKTLGHDIPAPPQYLRAW